MLALSRVIKLIRLFQRRRGLRQTVQTFHQPVRPIVAQQDLAAVILNPIGIQLQLQRRFGFLFNGILTPAAILARTAERR